MDSSDTASTPTLVWSTSDVEPTPASHAPTLDYSFEGTTSIAQKSLEVAFDQNATAGLGPIEEAEPIITAPTSDYLFERERTVTAPNLGSINISLPLPRLPFQLNFESTIEAFEYRAYQHQLGYFLSPMCALDLQKQDSLSVANYCCGDGAWLIDLHHQLLREKTQCYFVGFDNTDINFPPTDSLPQRVQLYEYPTRDIDVEEDVYDVIHIRGLNTRLPPRDLQGILSRVWTMLKPGGWIQWEELGPWTVEAPSPSVSKIWSEKLVAIMQSDNRGFPGVYSCVQETLRDHGFVDFEHGTNNSDRKAKKAWTGLFLLTLHNKLEKQYPSIIGGNSGQAWSELSNILKEVKHCVRTFPRYICVAVARKPRDFDQEDHDSSETDNALSLSYPK